MTTATLLGLYLKLNLVLAASYALWLATKQVAVLLRFEVGHARQLMLARVLFTAVVVLIPLALTVNAWTSWFEFRDSVSFFAADFSMISNLDDTLARRHEVSSFTLVPAVILALLLLGGLGFQLTRLARQVRKLRAIVKGATEYKSLGGIHLLFSSAVSTPFSTLALGQKQIVLPYQLLDSPHNLRLAVKHELQHIRNRDLEWILACEVAGALFFWNPAMWLWHNEFDSLQEFACDEALINDRRVSSTAYGNCLLEVARASTGCALIASSSMVPRFSFWTNHHSQLKRRILMLTNDHNRKHAELKSIAYALLTALGLLQTALIAFAAESETNDVGTPVVRINPEYPADALSAHVEGFAIVRFTITETGAVEDATVIDNCAWPESHKLEDCKPDDIFNSSAISAVSKWRYNPIIEDGQAVAREGVQTVIRFALDPRGEGCIYSTRRYPAGSKIQARVYEPNDTVNPRTVEWRTCVEDPEKPGEYTWAY